MTALTVAVVVLLVLVVVGLVADKLCNPSPLRRAKRTPISYFDKCPPFPPLCNALHLPRDKSERCTAARVQPTQVEAHGSIP